MELVDVSTEASGTSMGAASAEVCTEAPMEASAEGSRRGSFNYFRGHRSRPSFHGGSHGSRIHGIFRGSFVQSSTEASLEAYS